MNELNQHKKNDKIKWVFTVIAFVLVFVMLAGVFMQLFGKGKVQPSEWFKKPETEQTQTAADNIVVSPIESRGVELCSAAVPVAEYAKYGIDPQAVENVFELSVTYTPANTTFQGTDYSIKFKNASSTWATGKAVTDYAALQHESGSKTATLTIKKAFEEQIIVTARSQRDETKYATFTVDYLCTDVSIDLTSQRFACDEDIYVTPYRWVGGTLAPESNEHIYAVFEVLGADQLSNECGFTVDTFVVYALNDDILSRDNALGSIYEVMLKAGHYSELTTEQKAAYLNALGELYSDYVDGDTLLCYGFCCDRFYNGVNYGGTYPDDFSTSSLGWSDLEGTGYSDTFEVNANSLIPNNSHIVAV